jgi:hypothetical protein
LLFDQKIVTRKRPINRNSIGYVFVHVDPKVCQKRYLGESHLIPKLNISNLLKISLDPSRGGWIRALRRQTATSNVCVVFAIFQAPGTKSATAPLVRANQSGTTGKVHKGTAAPWTLEVQSIRKHPSVPMHCALLLVHLRHPFKFCIKFGPFHLCNLSDQFLLQYTTCGSRIRVKRCTRYMASNLNIIKLRSSLALRA